MSTIAPISPDVAWRMVEDHMRVIERVVATAISRGLIARQDRDDAIANGMMKAYDLVQLHDTSRAPFEHYPARTLSRNLLRDATRETTDAMSRVDGGVEIDDETFTSTAATDRETQTNEIGAHVETQTQDRLTDADRPIARMYFVEHLALDKILRRTGRKARAKSLLRRDLARMSRLLQGGDEIETRIQQRVAPRYQAIARMAHVENRPIWYIAKRTGHHGRFVRRIIAHTTGLIFGRRSRKVHKTPTEVAQ